MKLAELRTPMLPSVGKSSQSVMIRKNPSSSSGKKIRNGKGKTPTPPRPAMATAASSRALFHVNSLVGQVWLMQLRRRIQARYGMRDGRRPALQTGYAWRSFSTFFEPLSAIEQVRLFENLLRFASFEGYAPARAFFLAYAPLAFEHDCSREYIGPGVWSPSLGLKKAALRVRRTLQRWCEWLEALTHFQVHSECRPGTANRDLDKAIILLWPLAKRHQWCSGDLLAVLRAFAACGETFPCQSEEQLTAYCRNSFRLQFPQATKKLAGVLPAGSAVAERLLKFLPSLA